MTNQPSAQKLISILEFYRDSGVEYSWNENPQNFLQPSSIINTKHPTAAQMEDLHNHTNKSSSYSPFANKIQEKLPVVQIKSGDHILPDEGNIKDAQNLAERAHDIEQLRHAMENFDGCPLKKSANKLVFSDGNPNAKIMLIGEAPGRDEDRYGVPFVGKAGQLLDRILAAIDLNRDNVYITNIIPWRPPGNRTPTPIEIRICEPFIRRHMELINPDIVILLGNVPSKTLLETKTGIMQMRGKWQKIPIGERYVDTLPTLHPAYLLRQPAHKRLSWQDFLSVKKHQLGLK